MADFQADDLRGSTFELVDLSGSRFVSTRFNDTVFRGVAMHSVTFRGAELCDVEIEGELQNVTINGVAIAPLIDAELNRRDPERVKMRPTDPAGFAEAWAILERRWAATVERARRLPPEVLHESVDGEWSFIQTLRHLVFATDSWIRRALLGDPAPWHPLGLPWDEMRDKSAVPHDRDVRPSLDTVLAVRCERMDIVRSVIAGLTPEYLAGDTAAVDGPGWPEPRSYPVRECLLCILNEEWEHRGFAERDLGVLGKRVGSD